MSLLPPPLVGPYSGNVIKKEKRSIAPVEVPIMTDTAYFLKYMKYKRLYLEAQTQLGGGEYPLQKKWYLPFDTPDKTFKIYIENQMLIMEVKKNRDVKKRIVFPGNQAIVKYKNYPEYDKMEVEFTETTCKITLIQVEAPRINEPGLEVDDLDVHKRETHTFTFKTKTALESVLNFIDDYVIPRHLYPFRDILQEIDIVEKS